MKVCLTSEELHSSIEESPSQSLEQWDFVPVNAVQHTKDNAHLNEESTPTKQQRRLRTKVSLLEDALDHYTATNEEEGRNDPNLQAVKIYQPIDAYLLRASGTSSPFDPLTVASLSSTGSTQYSCDDNDDGNEMNNENVDIPATILGIVEAMMQQDRLHGYKCRSEQELKDMSIDLEILQPSFSSTTMIDNEVYFTKKMSSFIDPSISGDWTRRPLNNDNPNNNEGTNTSTTSSTNANTIHLHLVDLTPLQKQRRTTNHHSENEKYIRMDSPGSIFHLLRSILHGGNIIAPSNDDNIHDYQQHFASPWRYAYHIQHHHDQQQPQQQQQCDYDQDNLNSTNPMNHMFAILLSNKPPSPDNHHHDNEKYDYKEINWDALEQAEIDQLFKFRVGDCSPSHYLHSINSLQDGFDIHNLQSDIINDSDNSSSFGNSTKSTTLHDDTTEENKSNGATLFIYRHLPQRRHLSTQIDSNANILHPSDAPFHNTGILPKGCLWEKMKVITSSSSSSQTLSHLHPMISNKTEQKQFSIVHRLTAPPYQSHEDLFPNLLDELLAPTNLQSIVNEVKQIPQWTAWPERNHYSSDYDDAIADGSAGASGAATYPASWTVFPLCHTFPATDIDARKFINVTCNYVPETTRLLKSTLGTTLRTALFSRLEPRTRLEAHTGWSDLANNVLRVHIPLIIPSGSAMNNGLCGTWVDGCVETHEVGKVISFDDSKVHRAFNYSEEERIVLILDLARPTTTTTHNDGATNNEDYFPVGTSTGGHTNELDDFIAAFE